MKPAKLNPKTVRLLRRIQKQIKAEPKQFVMRQFFLSQREIPNCGTACCIAGWAITLGEKFSNPKAAFASVKKLRLEEDKEASAILRLPVYISENLFYETYWPDQFQGNEPLSTRAIKRIDFFIKTNGTDNIETQEPK